jgi:hypothetical protein
MKRCEKMEKMSGPFIWQGKRGPDTFLQTGRTREFLPSAAAPVIAATASEHKQQHDDQDD